MCNEALRQAQPSRRVTLRDGATPSRPHDVSRPTHPQPPMPSS